MKLLALFCYILVVSFTSQVSGDDVIKTTTRGNYGSAHGIPNTTTNKTPLHNTTTYHPPQKPQRPCEPNGLGDYKGGCDDSVPVIVMPMGRPIMESVLDWFKSCLKN
ncbi:hypothetical protein FF38_06446 [Lucilia cuprina]|uniref:Uncharacterized protein n=1 Tax=Lucilia cuprina TaxID=7375 RepID=A0A0L0CRN0_LUCCU|nr:hypothetical protein CVS40_4548 [Lucilia cuprina]KNC34104.1 hypothetical protein FF38_06446 [Lucilia cuprina]